MSIRRREFLLGTGSAAAAIAFQACADDSDGGVTTGVGEVPAGDLDVMAFAVGVELVIVHAYQELLDAARAGALGEVPPVAAEFIATALAQHEAYVENLNSILEENARDPVTEPNSDLKAAVVDPALAAAKSFVDAAKLSRTLEAAAGATYLKAVQSQLQSDTTVRLAAGIQAVDQKRVAVLNYVLGEYPVPDVFQKTDAAITA